MTDDNDNGFWISLGALLGLCILLPIILLGFFELLDLLKDTSP